LVNLYSSNKLVFDGRAEENRQQTVDKLAGIPAQIWDGSFLNTCLWALPLLHRSWLQRTYLVEPNELIGNENMTSDISHELGSREIIIIIIIII